MLLWKYSLPLSYSFSLLLYLISLSLPFYTLYPIVASYLTLSSFLYLPLYSFISLQLFLTILVLQVSSNLTIPFLCLSLSYCLPLSLIVSLSLSPMVSLWATKVEGISDIKSKCNYPLKIHFLLAWFSFALRLQLTSLLQPDRSEALETVRRRMIIAVSVVFLFHLTLLLLFFHLLLMLLCSYSIFSVSYRDLIDAITRASMSLFLRSLGKIVIYLFTEEVEGVIWCSSSPHSRDSPTIDNCRYIL